jgi:hypothetical protein
MDTLLVAIVNGVEYNLPQPTPKNYKYQNTHLENSYINAKGYLHRDIIRKNRAKIFCGWDALDADEMALLEFLYDQTYFYLRCTDNYNNRVTKKVYAGPLDGKAATIDELLIIYRTEVQMNFIEY